MKSSPFSGFPRSTRTRSGIAFPYERLEQRQVLTSLVPDPGIELHLAADSSMTVATRLAGAPELLDAPDHGTLQYDSQSGTLLYRADAGFTGQDSFQLGPLVYVGQNQGVTLPGANGVISGNAVAESVWSYSASSTVFSVRVWEPLYAAPDWSLIQPGTSAVINVLNNDYVFSPSGWGNGQWQQDPAGLRIISISSGSGGLATITGDGGRVAYEAASGFAGTDRLTYVVEDKLGNRSAGAITVEVSGLPHDGQGYFGGAHRRHVQVDAWLEQFAASLTGGWQSNRLFHPRNGMANGNATTGLIPAVAGNLQDGDIVQLDGNRLFSITHTTGGNGQLQSMLSVVDLSDPLAPRVLATRMMEGRVIDLFVDGDRLGVVFDSTSGTSAVFVPGTTLVTLQVLADGSQIETWRAEIEGRYADGYLFNGQLMLVTSCDASALIAPRQLLGDKASRAVSPGDFIDRLLGLPDGFGQPAIRVVRNGVVTTLSPDLTATVRRTDRFGGTLVSTFELASANGTPTDMDYIESERVRTVYASAEGLLLLDGQSMIQLGYTTGAPGVGFVADGALAGSVPGSSSINFAGDLLRLVYTDARDGSIDFGVFRANAGDLVLVGSLEDIAPGEQLFATQFSGDQLFVVTFDLVDPLFVIDLSVAEAPRIAGELTVPGYSSYLRLVGDHLLLAIGREAPQGQIGTGGLQVSLFDVSNPSSPLLLHRYTFAGGGSTVSAAIDRWMQGGTGSQSVTWDVKTGMLYLPVATAGGWTSTGDGLLFPNGGSGIAVLRLDRAEGITLTGMIEFADEARRAGLVGDYVVFSSPGLLQIAARSSPWVSLAKLRLDEVSPQPVPVIEPAPLKPETAVKTQSPFVSPSIATQAARPNLEHSPLAETSSVLSVSEALPAAVSCVAAADVTEAVAIAPPLTMSPAGQGTADQFEPSPAGVWSLDANMEQFGSKPRGFNIDRATWLRTHNTSRKVQTLAPAVDNLANRLGSHRMMPSAKPGMTHKMMLKTDGGGPFATEELVAVDRWFADPALGAELASLAG